MNGSQYLNEVRVDRMQLGDDQQPCLAIAYSLTNVAAEVETAQKNGVSIAIDADGGSGSKLRIAVTVSSTDETGTATTATTNIDGATYTTLIDVIDALNAIEGITAWALNALHSQSTDSDDFIDLASTELRTDGKPLECLYRDVSEDAACYMRVGNPTYRDSGRMNLLGINGTSTGNTNGTLKVYRDDYSQGGTEEELLSFAQATAETAYVSDNKLEALTFRGPLVIAVASDDLTVCDIKCRTTQAEW